MAFCCCCYCFCSRVFRFFLFYNWTCFALSLEIAIVCKNYLRKNTRQFHPKKFVISTYVLSCVILFFPFTCHLQLPKCAPTAECVSAWIFELWLEFSQVSLLDLTIIWWQSMRMVCLFRLCLLFQLFFFFSRFVCTVFHLISEEIQCDNLIFDAIRNS